MARSSVNVSGAAGCCARATIGASQRTAACRTIRNRVIDNRLRNSSTIIDSTSSVKREELPAPGTADFAVELVEGSLDACQDLAATGGETIDTRAFCALRFLRAEPAARRHTRQHRIQRARADAIPMMVQLFQHPLAVQAALLCCVIQYVDLPEREQELPLNRVAHGRHASTGSRTSTLLLLEPRALSGVVLDRFSVARIPVLQVAGLAGHVDIRARFEERVRVFLV